MTSVKRIALLALLSLASLLILTACSPPPSPLPSEQSTCKADFLTSADEHTARAWEAVDKTKEITAENDALIAHPWTPGAATTIQENVNIVFTLVEFGKAEVRLSQEARRAAAACKKGS